MKRQDPSGDEYMASGGAWSCMYASLPAIVERCTTGLTEWRRNKPKLQRNERKDPDPTLGVHQRNLLASADERHVQNRNLLSVIPGSKIDDVPPPPRCLVSLIEDERAELQLDSPQMSDV